MHHPPTVHQQRLPADERALVGHEEGERSEQVGRGVGEPAGALRCDESGGDRVDPDPGRPQLARQRAVAIAWRRDDTLPTVKRLRDVAASVAGVSPDTRVLPAVSV